MHFLFEMILLFCCCYDIFCAVLELCIFHGFVYNLGATRRFWQRTLSYAHTHTQNDQVTNMKRCICRALQCDHITNFFYELLHHTNENQIRFEWLHLKSTNFSGINMWIEIREKSISVFCSNNSDMAFKVSEFKNLEFDFSKSFWNSLVFG